MSELLDSLLEQHQEKLDQLGRGETNAAFVDGIRLLIGDLRQAGEEIVDAAERAQLRALLRFWGSVVYDRSGIYPGVTLLPPDKALPRPLAEPQRISAPRLLWLLLGGASAVIILAGALLVAWSVLNPPGRVAEAPAAPAAAPSVLQAAVGTGLGEGGVLTDTARSFCFGTPQLVATFVVEGLAPEVALRWELLRDGQVRAGEAAVPWGTERQYVTVRLQADDAAGLAAGEYELRLYAAEQVVARQAFEVLGVAPQISGLQVADVPELGASAQTAFQPGLRVAYLNYDYVGLCAGQRLRHLLYRGGELVAEQSEEWTYPAQGRRQVAFQGSGSLQFTAGEYELVVMIGDQEQGRAIFSVQSPPVQVVSEPLPSLPARFSNVVVALGAHPDGTPILSAQNVAFDRNTRVVYAIFDYQGLAEGVAWSAVWMRDGLEVAQREALWDLASAGSEGTHWAAYYDVTGRAIATGNYSVTLAIDDVVQASASFAVR